MTDKEKIERALELLEEHTLRIEGEWGAGPASIAELRALGDEDVQILDDARAALRRLAAGGPATRNPTPRQ